MREDNAVLKKSKLFAIRIINLYKWLRSEKDEYVMAKQLLRCGTSIGANIHEGEEAISKAEFISKLYISLKEARETSYWLGLLVDTNFITQQQYESVYADCVELIKLLTSIIKTAKGHLKEEAI